MTIILIILPWILLILTLCNVFINLYNEKIAENIDNNISLIRLYYLLLGITLGLGIGITVGAVFMEGYGSYSLVYGVSTGMFLGNIFAKKCLKG